MNVILSLTFGFTTWLHGDDLMKLFDVCLGVVVVPKGTYLVIGAHTSHVYTTVVWNATATSPIGLMCYMEVQHLEGHYSLTGVQFRCGKVV